MYLVLLFLSILPVYLLANYIYKNDFDKEPTKLIVKLFACGFGSAVLTLFISGKILYPLFPLFSADITELSVIELIPYTFLGVALVEEFCKWIFVYFITYKNKAFNHAYDAIVYAVLVSLGFACIENVMYVLSNYDVSVAVTRALLAVPGHACDAVFMGYFLALAKISDKHENNSLSTKNKIFSLLVPVILHGLYDYLIFASSHIPIFTLIFFGFVAYIFNKAIETVKRMKVLKIELGNSQNWNNSNVVSTYSSVPNANNVVVDYNYNSQLFNNVPSNNQVMYNQQVVPNYQQDNVQHNQVPDVNYEQNSVQITEQAINNQQNQ